MPNAAARKDDARGRRVRSTTLADTANLAGAFRLLLTKNLNASNLRLEVSEN
jgi:hypothetical protein